jgi:transposase-like protein
LRRELDAAHKTAWRMLRLIREAMGNEEMTEAFECFVEIDETYAGGKAGKENAKLDAGGNAVPAGKPKSKRGRGADKTPVAGVIERGAGKVHAKVMLPNAQGQKLSGKQLLEVIEKVREDGTAIAADGFAGYGILGRKGQSLLSRYGQPLAGAVQRGRREPRQRHRGSLKHCEAAAVRDTPPPN